MIIRNAKIMSTMFGREDHGIMTFMLYLKFYGAGCGYGGYALDMPADMDGKRVFSSRGLEAISRILDVVGVSRWEDLPGSYIRLEDNGLGSTVDVIGNLMEDKWFNIREFFKEDSQK